MMALIPRKEVIATEKRLASCVTVYRIGAIHALRSAAQLLGLPQRGLSVPDVAQA